MSHGLNKAQRLKRLEELLLVTDSGLTTSEIGSRLGISRHTAWRDIAELGSMVPIQEENNRYRIDRSQYMTQVRLNAGESMMLYLAMRLMIRRLTHIPPVMFSALEKMTLALKHPLTDQLAQSLQKLYEERPPIHGDVWGVLIRGWMEQVTVRFTYKTFDHDEETIYEIEPYLFEPVTLSEGVYLIGYSHTHNGLRTFKVERIKSAHLTTRQFEKHLDIQVDDLLQHAWGIWYGSELIKVRLRFRNPTVSERVKETLWHPSQEIIDLPEGGCEWIVYVAGTLELIPWIRGWGPDCEVIEPADLRRRIAEDMKRASTLYEKET